MYDNLRKIRTNKNISAEKLASVLNLETKAAYYKRGRNC